MAVAGSIVIKSRINKDVGRNILVELESERVFPFILNALVAGESIHAGLPLDVLGNLPKKVDGELRTEIGQ